MLAATRLCHVAPPWQGIQVSPGLSPPSETTSGDDSPWLQVPMNRVRDEGPAKAKRLCRENSVEGSRTPPVGAGEISSPSERP